MILCYENNFSHCGYNISVTIVILNLSFSFYSVWSIPRDFNPCEYIEFEVGYLAGIHGYTWTLIKHKIM